MEAQNRYALRFISGKYQGREFLLPDEGEIWIGRSSELDMVLVEDMVSRRHAKISVREGQIMLEDFGSTNGSFVNGEKITKCVLAEGDRVLVGTSIIKVVRANTQDGTSRREALPRESVVEKRRTSEVRTMSGAIEEIAIPDLLQLFSASRKSGVLVLKKAEASGRFYLREGRVVFACLDEEPDMPPLKSAFRLLAWEEGMFELLPPEDREFLDEITISTEALLMEGMRQIDEFKRNQEAFPNLDSCLVLNIPLSAPLSKLSGEELDLLQVAVNHKDLWSILNKSSLPDAEASQALRKLIELGYLKLQ